MFFILNTESKANLQIGRNATCDVRIGDDISVSRVHSNIRKIGSEYFIEDNNSTFGTLIQVQYPIFLTPDLFQNQPLILQSGKTQLTLLCKKQQQVTNCCDWARPSCIKKVPKKSNRGLATFDKSNYFPISFLETRSEQHSEVGPMKELGAVPKVATHALGLDEDNAVDPAEEEGQR